MTTTHHPGAAPFRVGLGFDRHRLAPQAPRGPGRPLVIGGVAFDSEMGPVAHSDGDALLHAITDAVSGACGLPDIGQAFPDTDAANDGRDSLEFLRAVARGAREAGWSIVNIDATVLLEAPKIGPVKRRIIESIAGALSIAPGAVNVKGKTGEGVGPVGRREAIEAHAVALCIRSTD
ncbi:MAG: 2-C-methyl-D-erythritol 2,4-cyclodiphosphate synthase [Phycisphaeraceae bacterium]|nr:2-C-methyl-D-erythritol 2,4-cyclodiphosphate synthase [Phycisphaeraceae bacterium]MCB9847763.1 2-C-methyl-D-erythritol 2,4-cyclodiphosphate synthase [Phycisphaeraceae bacterium]